MHSLATSQVPGCREYRRQRMQLNDGWRHGKICSKTGNFRKKYLFARKGGTNLDIGAESKEATWQKQKEKDAATIQSHHGQPYNSVAKQKYTAWKKNVAHKLQKMSPTRTLRPTYRMSGIKGFLKDETTKPHAYVQTLWKVGTRHAHTERKEKKTKGRIHPRDTVTAGIFQRVVQKTLSPLHTKGDSRANEVRSSAELSKVGDGQRLQGGHRSW